MSSKLLKREDNKGQSDDQTSFITYLRCLQSSERAGKELSGSREGREGSKAVQLVMANANGKPLPTIPI